MKLPTKLKKTDALIKEIATALVNLNTDIRNFGTLERAVKWIKIEDVFIFEKKEKGFEDWSGDDYVRMTTQSGGQPYGISLKKYILVHDYC